MTMRWLLLALALLGCTGAPSPRPRVQDGSTTTATADGGAALSAACVALLASGAPTPPELCNGADDDCDGMVDEDFPSVGVPCSSSCANGVGYEGRGACDGDQLRAVCQPAAGWGVCH